MLWGIFALLTGVAVFAVLRPLAKSPESESATAADVAFYRAKLDEIDRDLARANFSPEEAEAAKTEAARQLLAAADKETRTASSVRALGSLGVVPARWRLRVTALVALIFVPALTLGLYRYLGHPDWPDAPLEARLNAPGDSIDINAAIARVEAHLAQHPEDGRGYEILVPAYLHLGRIKDAVHAAQMALQTLGDSPERLVISGETLVAAANGVVTADARRLFGRAVAKGPTAPKALFFLGLAALQDGDKAKARDDWEKLLALSPTNAPWRSDLQARLAALDAQAPTADAAGIASLAPAQRDAAIRTMVDKLAARLAQNGQDIEGWLRLARAYKVLNEIDKARAAIASARRDFNGDAAATARIDALAHELGLNS